MDTCVAGPILVAKASPVLKVLVVYILVAKASPVLTVLYILVAKATLLEKKI
jgi:hypothetical protein